MKEQLVALGIPPGVAEQVVASYGHRLDRAGLDELASIDGMGTSRARRVRAAFELADAALKLKPGVQVQGTRAVYQHLRHLGRLEVEEVWLLRLDCRHRVLGVHTVARGTRHWCALEAEQVFALAIREGASAVIVVHNHASGDPTPSVQDYAITRRLVQAGELLGIPVLDHVIVAREGYASAMHKENK